MGAKCHVGCNPLVAPSSFSVAVRCWGMLEGWGTSASHPYCMLTQWPAEQLQMAQSLKAGATWWALTLASSLATEVRAILSDQGHVLAVFKRSTRAAACKGNCASQSCRLAKQRRTGSCGPVLKRLAEPGSVHMRAELKSRLDSTLLTEQYVSRSGRSLPLSAREAALGPAGAAYCSVIGTRASR